MKHNMWLWFVLGILSFLIFLVLILPVPERKENKSLRQLEKLRTPPPDSTLALIGKESESFWRALYIYDTESLHSIDLHHRVLEMFGAKSRDDPYSSVIVPEKSEENTPPTAPEFVDDGEENPIGLIRIKSFRKDTPYYFERTIEYLQVMGVEKFIVDLSDNYGGMNKVAERCLLPFMKPGDIAYTFKTRFTQAVCDAKYLSREYRQPITAKFRNLKLVILVNKKTASAAELFAGAMQDWGFKLIGEKTQGKGVGQNLFPLPNGLILLVTTLEFFPGNHRLKVDKAGITPDFLIKDTRPKEDLRLKKAIEILKAQ